MSKHPTLRIVVSDPIGSRELRAAVAQAVNDGVGRIARALGLKLETDVDYNAGTGAFKATIDGNRIYFARVDVLRARMSAARRLLTAKEVEQGLDGFADPTLDATIRTRWIASLIEAALITRPRLLLTRPVITTLAAQLNVAASTSVRWNVLSPLLQAAIGEGISVATVPKTESLAKALAASGQDAIELFVSMLHPHSLLVSLHARDLEQMLRHDPEADDRPLASIHERARSELGLSLPSIKIDIGGVAEGSYRLRINHLCELEQPLLSATQALTFREGASSYVVPWRTMASIDEVSAPNACTALQYLALELFERISTRGARLIERDQVHSWCGALGKPSLLALAMTSDHFVDLPRVLRALLAENVSIRDLVTILERIIDHHTIEVPPPHARVVISQAFPIVDGLPPKEARIIDSVRLGLGDAIHERIGASRIRVAGLSPDLERALTHDPSPAWRDQLVERLAGVGDTCDAIVTTLELRAIVRDLCDEAQSNLAVVSFQELSPTLEVVATDPITLPAGAEAGAATLPRTEARRMTQSEVIQGFGLLLADFASGRPALDELVTDRAPPEAPPDAQPRTTATAHDPIAKPDSLPDQGWAVVAPKNEHGAKLLNAIASLMEYRSEKQGARIDVFRVSFDESKRPYEWIRRSYESKPQAERPRYVLLLGDFDEISLELQLALAPLAAVGRLPLSAEELAVYAEKAIAADTSTQPEPIRPGLFVADDESAETQIAQRHLVLPCLERIERDSKVRTEPPALIDGTKAALLAAAQDRNFLLTASHGLGTKMPYDQRRKLQGAMLVQTDELLTADDVGERPFIPNGFWFMFACYGLGTPSTSSYASWIEHLFRSESLKERTRATIVSGMLEAHERPFAAALPRRALSNRRGPLAVIGHVDLAWSYGFMQDNQSRADRLYSAMRVILRGQLAGLALEQITQTHSFVADQLNEAYAQEARGASHLPEMSKRELSRLWMLRQDLRNFVLFGDPAARISAPGRRS